ncbi:FemAB family XrtA/PEP-CTERM system-associated protein [Aromatoleum diolicum]|uniref:FemAB family PEP-CTERM system-associated protein n=1 Tax=Aromatoleum diolicum TaxID=75796 RepID=A0ABX1QDI2_9RHOO|nr:FemAB family XrtA/PEP-CTERM system-associated protein [Aromatoleum diolicum]NMG75988.1 FemAB family PEP-CTERM system-associated protein [Aromatoleum diolicum]
MDRPPLLVKQLGEADRVRWDAFVRACPDATFFHLSAWRDIIRDVFRHRTFFLFAERAGEIVAVLPLAEVNSRLFGHALTSLPFCVYGGIAGAADAVAPLEAEAEALARRLGVQHLEFRNLGVRHADWPRQDLYVTFRKEILPDDEANLLAIPRKQRAMVRKAIRNGLASEIDADVERFFALYAGNVLRHGTPALPKAFFERLMQAFGGDCEVLTVTDTDGTAVSSVLSFYFRDEVLPYYAGDAVVARDLAANDFKYWELMRRACARGYRLFDFGRSKVGTGPYGFKKNWGFEPTPLSYEYRLYKRDAVPQNNPMNPKYRAFIALWRRLPLRVANALGPHIVRNLG